MKNNNRVVLDTNVLISALVFGGTPRLVIDLIATGKILPILSEEIMTEIRRVIRAKFPAFLKQEIQLEKLLHRYGLWVQLGTIDVNASSDPDDNKFIETALIGKCNYIVSGDKHLLDISIYENVRIVNPAEFLKSVQ